MRTLLFSALAITSVAALACSGSVVVGFGSGGSGNNGTGGTTTTSTTSSGGTTTTWTSTTSTGGSSSCGRTYEGFDMLLDNGAGQTWGCGAGWDTLTGDIVLEGEVVEVGPDGATLETCPPNADCGPNTTYKLSWSAPGLYDYVVPVGAFVAVSVHVYQPWGCEHALQIRNLPVWGGLPNPVMSGDYVYLVGADGSPTTFDGTPFSITSVALGCYPEEPPGCGSADDYLLRFLPNGGPPVDIAMGQTQMLVASPARYFDAKNLRSFETGWCDDYWNWSYWAVELQLLGD